MSDMDDGKKTDAERLLALMRSHRTIRKFTDAPVPDGLVRECVEAAQCATTSSNVQGYAIVRLRDAKTRARLVEMTGGQPQVAQAGAFFVLCADQRRHELAAEELRLAATALGHVTGHVDVEELLDVIFSDFCIGK